MMTCAFVKSERLGSHTWLKDANHYTYCKKVEYKKSKGIISEFTSIGMWLVDCFGSGMFYFGSGSSFEFLSTGSGSRQKFGIRIHNTGLEYASVVFLFLCCISDI